MAYIDIYVEEIECAGCATDIETVLLNLDGILEASVSYADKAIQVMYDLDSINEKQILSAIGGMGFRARVSQGKGISVHGTKHPHWSKEEYHG